MRGLAYINPTYREVIKRAMYLSYSGISEEISAPGIYEYLTTLSGKVIVMDGSGPIGELGAPGQVVNIPLAGICGIFIPTVNISSGGEGNILSLSSKTIGIFATVSEPDKLITTAVGN